MDEATKKALEGSIRKWKGIVAGTRKDNGVHNCPLCKMFNNDWSDDMCVGCPVYEAVGIDGCSETPYVKWSNLFEGPFPYIADTDEKKAAAQDELNFLISLREPKNQDAL